MADVSLAGDKIDHGLGAITTDVAATVSVGGIPLALVKVGIGAAPCLLAPAPPAGLSHIGQGPGTGSITVSAEGFPIHRVGDLRNGNCLGMTIALTPRAVSVGD